MDQRIGSTIHIAGLIKRILVLSIHIAAPATNDIDLAICIVPSRACILKPSICIAGWLRKILNETYLITYGVSCCPWCGKKCFLFSIVMCWLKMAKTNVGSNWKDIVAGLTNNALSFWYKNIFGWLSYSIFSVRVLKRLSRKRANFCYH